MDIGIVILLLIGIYTFIVIRKKIKDIKNGQYCSCGCQDCPSHSRCTEKEEKRI